MTPRGLEGGAGPRREGGALGDYTDEQTNGFVRLRGGKRDRAPPVTSGEAKRTDVRARRLRGDTTSQVIGLSVLEGVFGELSVVFGDEA